VDGSNPAAMPVPAGTTVTRWPGALSGLVGAAVALGSAEVFSGLAGDAVPSPVVAVADVVVDKAPGSAVRVGIDLLGTADKPVLIVGVVVVSAALAALVGARAAVRRAVGRPSAAAVAALLGAFAAVAFLAANRQATASPLGSLVAYAAAAMLGWLTTWMLFAAGVARAAQEARSTEPGFATPIDPPATRRQFLGLAGAGVAFAGLAAAGGSRLRSASAVTTERAALQLPVPASAVPTVAGALDGVVPGISPYIVPASDFYRIDTALLVPQVRADGWQLRIDGLVEREITLSFEELTAMTVVEAPVTLSCVSNEVGGNLVGNAVWRGVPLRDVLDLAGVKPDATQLASSSVDGWTCGFPVEAAFDGRDALVAFGMNGEPLTAEHGFPVRLVVPGLYGYVSATKWLNRLHLTRWEDFSGYWIPRGWSAQGPIKTQSRIDVPRNAATVAPGTVAVAGVAWAPTRGIAKVEVRVDEGEWQPARLGGVLSEDTWVQWVFEWDATPGKHLLQVRATDGTGAAQTGEFAPPAPDGATGWHAIGVIVE
jgi:DMSO/TMAO reductase YedYZ molybdopterin-dependent catalytic subunit